MGAMPIYMNASQDTKVCTNIYFKGLNLKLKFKFKEFPSWQMIICHSNENQSNRTSLGLQISENLKVYSLLWLIHFCQHHLWRLHGSNLYRKIWSLPQYKVQEKFSFEYSALESLMGREKGKLKIYTHSNKKILQLFTPLKTLHSL